MTAAKWTGRICALFLPVVSLMGFSFASPQATTATARLTATNVAQPSAPTILDIDYTTPLSARDEDARQIRTVVRNRADAILLWNQTLILVAERDQQLAVKAAVRHYQSSGGPGVAQVSISQVMSCIAGHESGNYSESTHTGSGSGAYQFIPDTWHTWFGKWKAATGYPGYFSLAYQAPPSVQDAVLDYALRNGGAGNWSPKYGNDPCTVGMGG